MTHISTRTTQFAYFDAILDQPVWSDARILDFGGNVGGFLFGAEARVAHDKYWCLDLDRGAIEHGRRQYPDAHFVHYDRYSSEYNSGGVRSIPLPAFDSPFDFVLAFSVFTHVHQCEMLELVEQLLAALKPGGRLAFTFTDPSYDKSLSDASLPPGSDVRKRLERFEGGEPPLDVEAIVRRAQQSKWSILIDDELHVEPGDSLSHQVRKGRPGESYCTYYSPEHLLTLFPDAQICPPVSPDWQHCCVLRRT